MKFEISKFNIAIVDSRQRDNNKFKFARDMCI